MTARHGDREFLLRTKARRVIMGLIFNHEFEALEIRMRQLRDSVDVYIIQESNITAGKSGKMENREVFSFMQLRKIS